VSDSRSAGRQWAPCAPSAVLRCERMPIPPRTLAGSDAGCVIRVPSANVLRARGLPLREAILESCRTRLRPILMTTTAIIAGLIPTSLGIGIGGTGRAAIAVTIIGGQSLCLFLTLLPPQRAQNARRGPRLLVPVAYVQFDAIERAVVGSSAKAWLAKVSAATIGRLRPATGSRQG
jgi:hypothetical protein